MQVNEGDLGSVTAPVTPADRLVALLAEALGAHATAATVFGAPIERDDVTIVPVARVRYGFGAGGGAGPQGRGAGGGGGGGVMASPAGFLEIRASGTRFRHTGDWPRLLVAAAAGALLGALAARAIGGACGRQAER